MFCQIIKGNLMEYLFFHFLYKLLSKDGDKTKVFEKVAIHSKFEKVAIHSKFAWVAKPSLKYALLCVLILCSLSISNYFKEKKIEVARSIKAGFTVVCNSSEM